MNEQDTQQLVFRSKRWPWKWFRVFRDAATICEMELCRSNVIKDEYRLLKIEANELHKQHLNDAERIQTFRDDIQLCKVQINHLEQQYLESFEREKMLTLEVDKLREERNTLIKERDSALDGSITLFEFIRRNKVKDNIGNDIPIIRRLPHLFRR